MTTRKTPLRAVQPGETPATPPKKLTLDEAIELGNPLEIARAQRRDIATKLKSAKGPSAAALHRQLSMTNDKIELLEAREEQEERKRAEVPDQPFDATAI